MSQITGANDVELVVEGVNTRGTAAAMGRIVVDDYTTTREEGSESVSGVGFSLPAGIVDGDITFSFSFTMLGEDTDLFESISDGEGRSRVFAFTARKVNDDGTIEWEDAFQYCKATMEEKSASSGDALEYAVEGIAVRYSGE